MAAPRRSAQRYLTLSNQLSPLMILERSGRWPSRGQMTGMLGTYLFGGGRADTAGLVVSMASRNARGADLLVADQDCQRAWSIRVKTNRKPASLAAQQRLSRGFVRDAYLSLRESARRCQAGLLHCSEPRREEAWRNDLRRAHLTRIFAARCRARHVGCDLLRTRPIERLERPLHIGADIS